MSQDPPDEQRTRPQTEQPALMGRYELTELVGTGGMAEVHRGWDLDLDRPVAIKLLPRTTEASEQEVQRLRREARAAASLSHANVVAVHDIGWADDRVFVVMEYLDGETVRDLVARQGPLLPDEAVRIAAEVCRALDAAHAGGVVHRDISPGNILVCGDVTVKVLDFGIAHMADAGFATESGMITGTPAYLSPEQARGAELDARSDLYSLGCCLYQMVTGQPPFTGSSPAAFAYQHVHDDPPEPRVLVPALPATVQEIIARAMAKEPDDRYPTAAAMGAALARVGASSSDDGRDTVETAPAPETADTEQILASSTQLESSGDGDLVDSDRGARRRRFGVALIAAALAALAAVAAVILYQVFAG